MSVRLALFLFAPSPSWPGALLFAADPPRGPIRIRRGRPSWPGTALADEPAARRPPRSASSQDGSNAVDAAIAANAMLGLVEPTSMHGLEGDLFAIVQDAKTQIPIQHPQRQPARPLTDGSDRRLPLERT